MKIRRWSVGLLAAFFVLLALRSSSEALAQESEEGALAVARVIDGDSLLLTDGTQVRLIGVDAPEFKDQKRNRQTARRYKLEESVVSAYAVAAKRHAEGVVLRGGTRPVHLELDPANVANRHRDKYGRLLAYVWIDSVQLNAELIREGQAFVIRYFPYKYREEFDKLEDLARKEKKGIWSHV